MLPLNMCPHTTMYASTYYYICVLILPYICAHTRDNAGAKSSTRAPRPEVSNGLTCARKGGRAQSSPGAGDGSGECDRGGARDVSAKSKSWLQVEQDVNGTGGGRDRGGVEVDLSLSPAAGSGKEFSDDSMRLLLNGLSLLLSLSLCACFSMVSLSFSLTHSLSLSLSLLLAPSLCACFSTVSPLLSLSLSS